ncbi:lysylphosphatidylglycerol synthase domain-containing protein [Caenispirillum bisanense]|uniref:lysylphosphatidylglycerol synthase domain-containing protein n=1 Tax=Caenispirillum bisanense TaxID=414052 RepID=UPI0031DF0C64
MSHSRPWARRILHWGSVAFALGLLAAALSVVHEALRSVTLADVLAAAHRVPAAAVWLGVGFAIASHACLCVVDMMAMRYVGARQPWPRIFAASFVSQAISHNVGFGAVTGGAIRYRMYSHDGVGAGAVARIMVFTGGSFGLGALLWMLVAVIGSPRQAATITGLPVEMMHLLALAGITVVAAAALWTFAVRRSLPLPGLRLAPPRRWMLPLQGLLAMGDIACAGLVLYTFLPDHSGLNLGLYLGLYTTALMAGIASHVPGGLGVFEGAILVMLPGVAPESVIGAALLYRLTYNLVPLALAGLMMAAFELHHRHRQRRRPPSPAAATTATAAGREMAEDLAA